MFGDCAGRTASDIGLQILCFTAASAHYPEDPDAYCDDHKFLCFIPRVENGLSLQRRRIEDCKGPPDAMLQGGPPWGDHGHVVLLQAFHLSATVRSYLSKRMHAQCVMSGLNRTAQRHKVLFCSHDVITRP